MVGQIVPFSVGVDTNTMNVNRIAPLFFTPNQFVRESYRKISGQNIVWHNHRKMEPCVNLIFYPLFGVNRP